MARRQDEALTLGGSGELAGSLTAVQMPDIPCKRVIIEGENGNAGNVYIGTTSGVTIADGTTDTTTGIEVAGGAYLELYVSNMNELYYICDNAADDITYIYYT